MANNDDVSTCRLILTNLSFKLNLLIVNGGPFLRLYYHKQSDFHAPRKSDL